MIDDDIKEGRKHLDMTDGFPFGGHGGPANDLEAIREELEEGEMPLLSYRMMHWGAKPSAAEKDSIYSWIDRGLNSLATIGIVPEDHDEHGDEEDSD
jgi:hypothetical protein